MVEHKPVILVFDDEEANQEVLRELPGILGYDCVTAGDGVGALEAVARKQPDLIFLDAMMPRMGGYEGRG